MAEERRYWAVFDKDGKLAHSTNSLVIHRYKVDAQDCCGRWNEFKFPGKRGPYKVHQVEIKKVGK